MFVRLAGAMGQPELASADRFGPQAQRMAARAEVNGLVAAWVGSLDSAAVLERCGRAGTPASLIYSIADIFEDPQYRARGNIRTMASRIGDLAVPEVVPRLSATPGSIEWLGEALGAHNDEVFGTLLGMTALEIEAARAQGVI